jgi:ADP-heptose:LPS heptosyltransferase
VPAAGERIAILTLQRLGDVLTAARVTQALSDRHNTAAVEVIHWDATAQAAALLPGVAARHALPFAALRRRSRAHAIAALHALSTRVDAITGGRGFDTVVNLSSTRFACWLAPALVAEHGRLLGPSIDGLGRFCASHPAITYLNDWGVDPALSVFAHQDLYALAAGVRLAGYAGLREAGGRRSGPIVFHVLGSERVKDWRTLADWRTLVGRLGAELGRPCVLVGAPGEAAMLEDVARGSGASVATWPLSACVELLAEATGLVSVDTVAIHAAAQVGCPAVVLRQGSARGLAFVAGPQSLCVDADPEPASVDDVVALAARHFCGRAVALPSASSIATRVRVRVGVRDGHGLLGLGPPEWMPRNPQAEHDERSDARWRAAWREAFAARMPDPQRLEQLATGNGRDDRSRYDALLEDPSELGAHARSSGLPRRSAA